MASIKGTLQTQYTSQEVSQFMGAWGTGMLDNDVAEDARLAFEDALASGASIADAIEATRTDAGLLDEYDEQPVLTLALAWLASARDALSPELRDAAISVIREGRALMAWVGSDSFDERRVEEQRFLDILKGRVPHPDRNAG